MSSYSNQPRPPYKRPKNYLTRIIQYSLIVIDMKIDMIMMVYIFMQLSSPDLRQICAQYLSFISSGY